MKPDDIRFVTVIGRGDSMRHSAFVHLVASSLASLSFAASATADAGSQISGPIVHDNLAIYFVHGAAANGAAPLTLQEALAKGTVKVHETGSVNELTVENTGTDEVFVQAGDIVKGGRQDRVLSVDLLLPPRSKRLSIAAFCVEPGRWTARGDEDARQFSSAAAAMPSHQAREVMMNNLMESLPLVGSVVGAADEPTAYAARSDTSARQQEIWSSVRKTQDNLSRSVGETVAASASPSSLQLSLENDKLKEAQAAYIAALQGAGEADADIVGYVFAVNGKIDSGDVYASNALFRKMWRKLLAANVTEAIGVKDKAAAAAPTVKEVEDFLATASTGAKAERAINADVHIATLDSDASAYVETRRADGSWVHRNYLAKVSLTK
jgi:hypothetical protein